MTLGDLHLMNDEAWTPVKNVKRERYIDRKKREADEQAEKDQSDLDSDSSPSDSFDNIAEDAWAKPDEPKLPAAHAQQSSKKSAKKKQKKAKLTNADDLAALLKELILRAMKVEMRVAELGARIHECTGASWNKVYKPKFGTLNVFLQKRSDIFSLMNDKVIIRSEMPVEEKEVASPSKDKKKKPRKQKKAPKSSAVKFASASSKAPKASSHTAPKSGSGGRCGLYAFGGLLMAGTFAGAYWLTQNHPELKATLEGYLSDAGIQL